MQIVELEMVPLSLRPVLQRLYDMKTTQSALREGVLFSTKRNNYYYDTGTGKVIVLDDDTSYIFRVLFDPTLSAETFLISLTKVDPNAVKNLLQTIDAERLFQRPPLLSMGKEIAAGVTDTEQKVEQIILEVTEQCNFRCKYCVYSEDFSGNRDFGNRRMPTEIAFKAFVFITLPNLLPTVVLTTILSLVNSFKVFREAYLVAGNYPQESISTVPCRESGCHRLENCRGSIRANPRHTLFPSG